MAQVVSHPIIQKLVAEGARQGPSAFISPPNKNKQLITIDPTSKLVFPPSTHSKYSPAIRIKVDAHNSKKKHTRFEIGQAVVKNLYMKF